MSAGVTRLALSLSLCDCLQVWYNFATQHSVFQFNTRCDIAEYPSNRLTVADDRDPHLAVTQTIDSIVCSLLLVSENASFGRSPGFARSSFS
jgi:hypothetical protein